MKIISLLLLAILSLGSLNIARPASNQDYAVVVSATTAVDGAWEKVVAALQKKHHAAVVTATNVFGSQCRDQLRQIQPRYVAFVAKPGEVGEEFIRQANLLSREMDDDPYGDFIWGIITGGTPEAALRLATVEKPLVVRRALTTTGINAAPLDECLTLSDGKPGDFMLKKNGKVINGTKTNDMISAHERFLEYYNTNDVDLIVSSSHATEVNLEMPFTDGSIVISGERMFMVDKAGLRSFVRAASGKSGSGLWHQSPEGAAGRAGWAKTNAYPELRRATNPKIYIAAGNCLMGDPNNSTDSLVIDWLSCQGVNQFVGYTAETWYGKGGWGTLELWQAYGGQNNLAEAFFLNNQRLIHKLITDYPEAVGIKLDRKSLDMLTGQKRGEPTPEIIKLNQVLRDTDPSQGKDLIGCLYDRDVVALYGDPKWDARLDSAKAQTPVKWHWSGKPGHRTLEIECLQDFKKSELIILTPERMRNCKATENAGLNVSLNDEFVWISQPDFNAGKSYRIEITAAETLK